MTLIFSRGKSMKQLLSKPSNEDGYYLSLINKYIHINKKTILERVLVVVYIVTQTRIYLK